MAEAECGEEFTWIYDENFQCEKATMTTESPITIEPRIGCVLTTLPEGMQLVDKDSAKLLYKKKETISLKCGKGYNTSLYGAKFEQKPKMKAYCKVKKNDAGMLKYYWDINGDATCVDAELCPLPKFNVNEAMIKKVTDNYVQIATYFRKNRVSDPHEWTALIWCPFNIRGSDMSGSC